MKLVITGASGFVAQDLVPLLIARGIEPVLISDRTEMVRSRFPDLTCDSYDRIGQHLPDAAGVLHLAAKNNDTAGTLNDFRKVNVGQTLDVLAAARDAGVPHFIFASSFHTLGLTPPDDPYARSKAEAEAALQAESGISISVLHLPAVYGQAFKGKLAMLNRVPAFGRKLLLPLLGALKPVVHVSAIADRVARILRNDADPPHYLRDPALGNPVFIGAKRIVDLVAALALLVFLGWLMVIVWVAVRLDSPGPGLFRQERVGRNGKSFICYKFRTMQQGTKQAGTHEVGAASVTRLGRVLRKTKLDELPQIVNIFRNEMSLIGPRPCLPSQTALVAARQRAGVLTVKPGISGLAQVHDIDMSDPDRLARVDALYVAQASLVLDLRLMIKTLTGAGQGDKVRGA
ncbi:hybrid nucleoside-diphosphate sugar epimerase/sugar transferase [Yoonia sp.]|uniref:hybrid nucleoside-diphosphate sugar epimerase/sugar transferase n=1 Tax=Yoonia sp. TaxID=2212373 RepID=UPI002FDAA6FA